MAQYMTPTEHEKAEWSRMAQDCYRHGLNGFGTRFSAASATCRKGEAMLLGRYDSLMADYRVWLTDGVKYMAGDAYTIDVTEIAPSL